MYDSWVRHKDDVSFDAGDRRTFPRESERCLCAQPPALFATGSSGGTIAAVRLLGELGIKVGVISSQPFTAAAWSRRAARSYSAPPEKDSERFLKRLLEIGASDPGQALLPTSCLLYTSEAYLAGAKKLERDDLDAAENDFKRALALDPEDRDYAVAISVTRQHRITELVQQSTEARQAGDQARAETLLARANGLDPQNPIVTEHIATALLKSSPRALPPDASPHASKAVAGNQSAPSENALTDRAGLVAGGEARAPWVVEAPALTPPIRLTPSPDPKSFHLRGTFKDVLQQVAGEYGIRTTFDDSVESKAMRFDVENISYDQAMSALNTMTHTFAVPLEPTSILLARDDSADRQRLERQSQETVYLPGLVPDRIREIADVMRNIFDAKQAIVQPSDSTIVVRAPEAIFAPMNTTIAGLLDSTGEVVIEMKLYEITTTRSTNIGAALPAQAGIYSVCLLYTSRCV